VVGEDTRVVDQDVDPTEVQDDVAPQSRRRSGIPEIRGAQKMPVAGELRARLLCRFFIRVVMQGNPHSARGKSSSDRAADAA
jgi:hypothetical protein